MVTSTDFLSFKNTNPFFRHYDLSHFGLNMNGKRVLNKGISLGTDHEKKFVMGYRTLFEASGIHH